MPPPADQSGEEEFRCKCKKCSPFGGTGKVLSRTTWYAHNPGGKGVRRPARLPQKEMDFLLSLPAPKLSKRRKGNMEKAIRKNASKQGAGSSSVRRTVDHNICAPVD